MNVTVATKPSPHPSPLTRCAGVSDVDDATSLIEDGQAVALVAAEVSNEPPQPVAGNALDVPVAKFTVEAGDLPTQMVNDIEAPGAEGINTLAAGTTYLVLLGKTASKDVFFLSDGVAGSFAMDGPSAFERCPNYADPANPALAKAGVTDRDQLIALFKSAFSKEGNP